MHDLRFEISNLKLPAVSTIVEDSLQISSFLQNKANLPDGKIDAKCVFTKDYEEKCG
jgi:hypothetical protein